MQKSTFLYFEHNINQLFILLKFPPIWLNYSSLIVELLNLVNLMFLPHSITSGQMPVLLATKLITLYWITKIHSTYKPLILIIYLPTRLILDRIHNKCFSKYYMVSTKLYLLVNFQYHSLDKESRRMIK